VCLDFTPGALGATQHKSIAELDASLALPLVSNAALAFLRRHLALAPGQIRPLDEAMRANSERLTSAEARLAAEASSKVNLLFVLGCPQLSGQSLCSPTP
jgi:hypothetical protein